MSRLAWILLLLPALLAVSCLVPGDERYYEDEQYHPYEDEPTWEAEPAVHWGVRYIHDHCERCPECCVADLWDGGEEDDDSQWCEDCPSDSCLCIQDEEGRWWLDATRAGTDDDPLNPLVPIDL